MSGTEWIAPTIAGIVTLVTAVIVAVSAARNRKKGALEQRAPDVTEAWAEADRARARMHLWEDAFYAVRSALRNLARRVSGQYPDFELTDEERKSLELQPPLDPK